MIKNSTEKTNTQAIDGSVRKKRQIDLFIKSISKSYTEQPIEFVKLDNPFTPNPLLKLFTNDRIDKYVTIIPKFPKIKPPQKPPKFLFPEPVRLPDPFYNPFLSQNVTKLLTSLFPVQTSN